MSLFKPTCHLLFYSFVFGGTTFYSYAASPVAFKTLERDQFSKLQSKVFPGFFFLQSVSPLILLFTSPIALTKAPIAALTIASISGVTNLSWLLPWTRRIKEERKALADRLEGKELEAFDKDLRKEFGKAHGLSLLFNFTNALGLLTYGIYLSKGILRYLPK
ncbi:hypothetical protein Kpol_1025p22 [Vanderwaltozyma polyspora DSM 70294]|uniref:TMEM205-like domain-containing protein n=1 Tax=Vanderwaltozyma polyspora (strain ATCC 22028 / DSM 70294 / BCRC 21397 / CBS 2163 / NBRC 10782 / NRRL Y-8283 / UCD 57-17) TaxID=436907 RepID=A7TKU7_VANPO|nr:uncharacterized protein Kpol_1025p22 [Vanderwaltozyma polyspora DSM 70294]EDO17102.1 hypothetical protein Kpol_1025p22 [Vanderwaltozyma polyspora DSM 70294]